MKHGAQNAEKNETRNIEEKKESCWPTILLWNRERVVFETVTGCTASKVDGQPWTRRFDSSSMVVHGLEGSGTHLPFSRKVNCRLVKSERDKRRDRKQGGVGILVGSKRRRGTKGKERKEKTQQQRQEQIDKIDREGRREWPTAGS